MSRLTAMAKVPVVLLDIANFSSAKHPQIVIGTEESLCTGTALQAIPKSWSLKQSSKLQPCSQTSTDRTRNLSQSESHAEPHDPARVHMFGHACKGQICLQPTHS